MRLKPLHRSVWTLVLQHRTPFETMVNDAMTSFLKQGIKPTKRQVCKELGLDYDDANDRENVTLAIAANKKYADIVYREAFIPLGQWDEAYQRAADDVLGYDSWKRNNAGFAKTWLAQGWSENDLHEIWIHSRIWEEFLRIIDRYNLHVFVATGTPWKRNSFRYDQPNFWDYMVKQIDVCRRMQKGVLTTLERHRLLGMILTSGETVEKTIQVSQDGLHMVSDGAPLRHRCEKCEENGSLIAFNTQTELFEHYKNAHSI